MTTSTSSDSLAHPRAAAVAIDGGVLRVMVQDGRAISVPLEWFGWLAAAGEDQRRDFKIIGGGAGIWWDALDEGVSVSSLFGLPEDL